MKLNNKGFAISTMMYIILILGLIFVTLCLTVLNSRSKVLNKLKNEVQTKVSDQKDIDNNILCKGINTSGNFEVGDVYDCDVSNTENYKFYVLSQTETTVDLVMGESLTFDKGTYQNDVLVDTESKVKYSSNGTYPKDALTVLKTITDNWFYLEGRKDTIVDDNNNINYIGYKARLLTYNDIKNYIDGDIINLDFIKNTLTSSIYKDNLVYSIDNNKLVIDKKTVDEFNIVPVITVSKDKIKN